MWPIDASGCKKHKEKKEKEKKTDNQYKLKKAMAIAIGLISFTKNYEKCEKTRSIHFKRGEILYNMYKKCHVWSIAVFPGLSFTEHVSCSTRTFQCNPWRMDFVTPS